MAEYVSKTLCVSKQSSQLLCPSCSKTKHNLYEYGSIYLCFRCIKKQRFLVSIKSYANLPPRLQKLQFQIEKYACGSCSNLQKTLQEYEGEMLCSVCIRKRQYRLFYNENGEPMCMAKDCIETDLVKHGNIFLCQLHWQEKDIIREYRILANKQRTQTPKDRGFIQLEIACLHREREFWKVIDFRNQSVIDELQKMLE